MTTNETFEALIRRYDAGSFLTGGHSVEQVAAEWAAAFDGDALAAEAWIGHRGFDAARCAAGEAAGVNPARQMPGEYVEDAYVAELLSNGDITITQALECQ